MRGGCNKKTEDTETDFRGKLTKSKESTEDLTSKKMKRF